jgi:ABC-type dipeptide/oligopeptide/nickel transport system permease component/ABC-type transport system substrate-binding protein
MRKSLIFLARFFAACFGFLLCLQIIGWMLQADVSKPPAPPPAEDVRAAVELRKQRINPKDPLILLREVDYSKGRKAAWWPKGEAPVLAELVEEGKLPSVEERVGSEPCVMDGVDGIGSYSGTWIKLGSSTSDITTMFSYMSLQTLVRWSPEGLPIVPYVARKFEVSKDNRQFTFWLRKGMRWSDGHPFTVDDILYWWEYEVKSKAIGGGVPSFMKVRGKPGRVEKINSHCFRVVFPEPNGMFLSKLASKQGRVIIRVPAHYLRQYHPELGDQEKISKLMASCGYTRKVSVYHYMRSSNNPEMPRLGPWTYRDYTDSPPYVYVRNPYYFGVDRAGNQLPYVDRVLCELRERKMVPLSAGNGEVTAQMRHMDYSNYTYLMSNRDKGDYEVFHWYQADRSPFTIMPNLNRRVEESDPSTAKKQLLLRDKRFRQALSLAINRKRIITAEYNNQGEPAQTAPGVMSPFYHPGLLKGFTEYDVERANALLDSIGLINRDFDGYRTFPDGQRMTFYLNLCNFTGFGPAQFVVDDWKEVGIRLIPKLRDKRLFHTEQRAGTHDFMVWIGVGEYLPIVEPRNLVPLRNSGFAASWGSWFARGGLFGNPSATRRGSEPPPENHPVRRSMELYTQIEQESDLSRQQALFSGIADLAAENVWTIGLTSPPPQLMVVRNGFKNVPRRLVSGYIFSTPFNGVPETWYFEKPHDSPGAKAQIKKSIITPTLRPSVASVNGKANGSGSIRWGKIILWCVVVAAGIFLIRTSMRNPYVARRLLVMIPTLFAISIITFTIIQIPPGDYLTTRIMELESQGESEAIEEDIKELKLRFFLDRPVVERYCRWVGFYWFMTFDAMDKGLIQGNMGRSMATDQSVNQLIGDRLLLTMGIVLATTLVTWVLAFAIGTYSAVKQYSLGDYVFTVLGFIGMCVPGFLLALVLMHLAGVSGLFSSEFAAQPEWNLAKLFDLLKHIWVPIMVISMAGTAGMIRVQRSNLLDELRKPYVITAQAKGMRPLKLLFKYPVRLALNPFVSGIGGIFPRLVSGGAIVAMVLSLPTIGPLLLSALLAEDMYLAGSQLMLLSMLALLGTLVSDLLLLLVDPRIRFKKGAR